MKLHGYKGGYVYLDCSDVKPETRVKCYPGPQDPTVSMASNWLAASKSK